MKFLQAMLVLLLLTVSVGVLRAETQTLFDPQRHMRVSEVREGMKGYGLSVFQGTRIEKFDVEVLSILHNFNPKYDVVLVRCKGANLEHTGSIAGMSGSPIYLYDESGRPRMVGAFAYGWPLMKDPVGGVQPIEYMLAMPEGSPGVWFASTQPSTGGQTAMKPQQRSGVVRWSLADVLPLPGSKSAPAAYPLAAIDRFEPNPLSGVAADDVTRLRPLATPLMTAGMSPRMLEMFAPLFKAQGLLTLQAGGMGGSSAAGEEVQLEPGSVIAVPLVTGDAEMTAIGTCTEVLGNRVWGFGHPFNNEGTVQLPMGSGRINAVIANLVTSFKLGSLAQTRGTLASDQAVGISGRIGDAPPTAPLDVRVIYADGSQDREYHFDAALHPRLTPLLGAAAVGAALRGSQELPQYHTLDYDITLRFANGKSLQVSNTAVNSDMAAIFFDLAGPMIAAVENPFERVMLKELRGTVRVSPVAREAEILSVNLPREKYRPGDTVKAFVAYRPFRAPEDILPVELKLPDDLPDGSYQLTISDWQRYFADENAARPFRFTAQNIDEVFAVLSEVASIRHNAVYARLTRQPDGVAVGRTAMPHLPSSRRQVLLDAGRSNTSTFGSSLVKTLPTELVISGAADFTITVDSEAKVVEASAAAMPAPLAPKAEAKDPMEPRKEKEAEVQSPPGAGATSE